MRQLLTYTTAAICLAFACQTERKAIDPNRKLSQIRDSIQIEIDAMIDAVNREDIEAYMAKMPTDFLIYDGAGEIITAEQQREFALRDWAIIDRTLANRMWIDSLQLGGGDSVYVFTNQRWERLMFQRDGVTLDTVLTTQRHRELWKRTPVGWRGYDVEELGGEVYVNGALWTP